MATSIAHIPRYTVEDLAHWEDRWELIHGHPYAMSPAPKLPHQRLAHRLAVLLDSALEGCEACEVLPTVNYRIADDTALIPDILVVCTEGTRDDGTYLTATPALVAEILSPSTAVKDRVVKREVYEAEGVAHYVIVDVDEQRVEVLSLDEEGVYRTRAEGHMETVPFDLGPCQFTLDLARLWPS